MAKKVGFEVIAQRSVCVDYLDGRSVSFRPGQRFEMEQTNSSVTRLLRAQEIRQLDPSEKVPPLPKKLGAPHRVQEVLKVRAEVEAAKKAAASRLAASRTRAAKVEEAKPTPVPSTNRKKKSKFSDTTADAPRNVVDR